MKQKDKSSSSDLWLSSDFGPGFGRRYVARVSTPPANAEMPTEWMFLYIEYKLSCQPHDFFPLLCKVCIVESAWYLVALHPPDISNIVLARMTIVAASRVSPIGISVFGHHRTRSGNAKRYEHTRCATFSLPVRADETNNRIESGTYEQLSPFVRRCLLVVLPFIPSPTARHSFGVTPSPPGLLSGGAHVGRKEQKHPRRYTFSHHLLPTPKSSRINCHDHLPAPSPRHAVLTGQRLSRRTIP